MLPFSNYKFYAPQNTHPRETWTHTRAIDRSISQNDFSKKEHTASFLEWKDKRKKRGEGGESYERWSLKFQSYPTVHDNRMYTIIKRIILLKGQWATLERTTRRLKRQRVDGTQQWAWRSYPRWKLGRPSGERRWVDRREAITDLEEPRAPRWISADFSLFSFLRRCFLLTRFFIFTTKQLDGSSVLFLSINSKRFGSKASGCWKLACILFLFHFSSFRYWSRIPGP